MKTERKKERKKKQQKNKTCILVYTNESRFSSPDEFLAHKQNILRAEHVDS